MRSRLLPMAAELAVRTKQHSWCMAWIMLCLSAFTVLFSNHHAFIAWAHPSWGASINSYRSSASAFERFHVIRVACGTVRQAIECAVCLQSLPEAALTGLEDADSNYNFGWARGKEALKDGQPDINKGSFYANPLQDKQTDNVDLLKRYPGFCR